MERISVQSKEIAVIGYDDHQALLEVVFRRGGVYHYTGVPKNIHQELIQAPSVGIYFTQKVKDAYPYNKVA